MPENFGLDNFLGKSEEARKNMEAGIDLEKKENRESADEWYDNSEEGKHERYVSSLEKIKREFPDFRYSHCEFIEHGADHFVIIFDGKTVFRFPKSEKYRQSFKKETKLLAYLKDKVTFQVPDYTYMSHDGSFGGYEMIEGEEMTPELFNELNQEEKEKATSDLANFLSVLHSVQDKSLVPHSSDYLTYHVTRRKNRYYEKRKNVISDYADEETVELIDTFFNSYVGLSQHYEKRLIHGDMYDRHVLLNTQKKNIGGVIDFGDSFLGDPAFDFRYFWDLGEDVVKKISDKYSLPKDENFLERSRWHHASMLIDSLYYSILKDRRGEENKAAVITEQLKEELSAILKEENAID